MSELAQALALAQPTPEALAADGGETELPLTPIQRRFFEHFPAGESHYNQAVLVRARALDTEALERALQALLQRHEALRLRFFRDADGAWRARVSEDAACVLEQHVLRESRELTQHAEHVQRALDIERGPLLRAACFELADGEQRLLLVAHHLAVDGVSWRIVLDDLAALYAGQTLPSATPWRTWVRALTRHANGDDVRADLAFWRESLAPARVLAFAEPTRDARALRVHETSVDFDRVFTAEILDAAPRAYRMRIDELLLAAWLWALRDDAGAGCLIDLEGHGRETLDSELDVSRSVGWFTTLYPLWIPAAAISDDERTLLLGVKEASRAVSAQRGLHYGLLVDSGELTDMPRASLAFNYLGRVDASATGPFALAEESAGQSAVDAAPWHALELGAWIRGGALSVWFRGDGERVEHARVQGQARRFEAALRRLVAHATRALPTPSPADFPLAHVTQSELDTLALGDVEDVYPATPAQQGLLFHSFGDAADGGGVYVDQFRFTLRGALDVTALQAAWRHMLERHEVLRTRFVNSAGGELLQVVERAVTLPFALDASLRALSVAAYERELSAWREQDVREGFALERAPLLRVRLFQRPDAQHDLLWTSHHALLDGWSTSRLLGELLQSYAALRRGASPELPRALAYRHYVRWLARNPTSEQFWRARFASVDAPAQLLETLPRLRTPEPGEHKHEHKLAASLDAQLKERARTWQLTLNTLLQAAWGVVLAQHADRTQVAFGITVSGRPADLPGVESMFGLMINSLPLWSELPPSQRVLEYLRALQASALSLREHEHTPLGAIAKWAGLPADALFDTLFVFENYPLHEALRAADASALDVVNIEKVDRTHYPLTLTVQPEPTLRIEWEWDGSRVARATAARLIAGYERVLQQLAAATPDTCLGDLQVSEPRVPQPLAAHAFGSVVSRIAAHAACGRRALYCEGVETSHVELSAASVRVASALRAAGVGAESLVGVSVSRNAGLVAALLGVWKAGGAYVPLDPTYPPARLAEMMTGVEVVVCDASSAELFADRQRVRIDQLGNEELRDAWGEPHPEQLAYVIYTSGSTGKPKGVAVSHGSLSSHIDDFLATYALTAEDRVLCSSTINFDVSLHELFPALCVGGSVVLRGDEPWTLETLTATLREQGVTFSRIATAYWQAWTQRLQDESFPTLRQVTVGGEGLAGDSLKRWFEGPLGCVPLDNLYGPTETTVAALRHRVSAADGGETIVPIGHAFGSRSARVLGRAGQQVPVGGVGELCIGGPTLARGYLGLPSMTAERFVPDAERAGARIYRSGDVCRERADGTVEFLGRADAQVKLRGYRIELGEIETALRAHAGVEASVAELKGEGEQKRLIGYVVGSADLDALKSWLQSKVPSYMVPSALMCLESLPLMPNGKVDRRALPEPVLAARERVAPRSEVEAVLWKIWRAVLKRDELGVTDNFFELGGDSILSLQILARAREAGWKLTPKQVFEHPTIEAAARVARAIGARREQAAISGAVPLTPIQARFFERHPGGLAHANQSILLASAGTLEPRALQRALSQLLARHDALRLRFDIDPTLQDVCQPRLPAEPEHAQLETIDIGASDDVAAALEREGERVQRSLDLQRGPLLRAAHFLLPGGDARLLLVVHHLAVDGVSWRVMLEELETLYGQAVRGETLALPTPGTPWSVWAHALSEYAARATVRSELALWSQQLMAAENLPLSAAGRARVRDGRQRSFELDAETTRQLLEAAPRAYRLRPDEVLLTALAQTLAHATGARGALIDLEGHGRAELSDELDVSRSVGWFTTRYPAWLTVSADSLQPSAALVQVKEQLRAIPNQGLHWGLLRYSADAETRAAAARLPRSQVSFNYLGQFDQALAANGQFTFARESAGRELDEDAALAYALNINALIEGGVLSVSFQSSPELIPDATLAQWIDAFDENLRRLIAHCVAAPRSATASDFPLARLTQAQLEALALPLDEVADIYPATPLQQGFLFHSLFEAEQPETSGLYVYQLRLTLAGALRATALRRAWEDVVARHDILRTQFAWQHGGAALQVVQRQVKLPFVSKDWSGVSDYDEQLAVFLREDVARGFDLAQAPLLRVAVFARPDGRHDVVWTMHHALADGWSSARLVDEVIEAYRAHTGASVPELRAAPPFREYVAWLAEQPSSEALWRELAAQVREPAQLMAANARAREPEPGTHHRYDTLPAPLAQRLTELARAHEITLSTLMQAAWGLVLAHHADAEQAVFGTTVSGRPPELAGSMSMIGLFINSLPVWVDVPAGARVADWLRAQQRRADAMRQAEHTPLSDVQRWLGSGGESLFDTLFVFENFPASAEARSIDVGLTIERSERADRTHYPLTLTVVAEPELELEWEWDGARVDRARCEALAAAYTRVLTQLASATNATCVAELEVSEARAPQPLAAHAFGSVVSRIAAHAACGRRALYCEGVETSHVELSAASVRVASALRAAGVGAESLVGVSVSRNAGLVAALLGVWKAGGAYVPLDPTYPPARLAEMMTGVEVVVCDASSAELFADRQRVRIDQLGNEELRDAWQEPHPEQLAYVIYTSGSTGKPKGVAVSHGSLCSHIDDFLATYALTAEDRVLCSSTINFDVSLHELFPALCVGGSVVLRGDEPWTLETLTATLREQGVTFSRIATAYWQAWTQRLQDESFPTLRQVTVGGEGLAGDALKRWFEGPLGCVPLDNLYGPTETTVAALRHRVSAADGGETIVPIGHAFGSRSARVLGRAGQQVPVGGVGELCIGGPTLARGYLGLPSMTAERFVPDAERPGARIYRSGDVCRERADGTVEFLGRADAQVKLRGYRIELGEIETALRAHAGVEASVVELKGEGEQKRLIGYVVGSADLDALKSWLQSKLPSYMVPSALMCLESLPLMPNGKVDRRALPEPVLAARERVAPRSEVEAVLWKIWRAVLKRDELGVTDNFFELGGDSILSLQILARAREAGWKLTPKQVFEHPTIEAAARVARAIGARREQAAVSGAVPLTPIQARFFERHPHAPAHFNQSVLLSVDQRMAPLDRPAFQRVLAKLIERHDALRMRFMRGADGFVAHVADVASAREQVTLIELDLRHERELEPAIERACQRIQKSLDLQRGPLLRAAYLALPNDQARVLLVVHHLAVDGVSWRILLEELESGYAQAERGEPLVLPASSTPWSVWAVALERHAHSVDAPARFAYWRDMLARGADSAPAFGEGDRRGSASRAVHWRLSRAETERLLLNAPRAYHTRVDELLLTALAHTLAAWTAASGVLIDLEGHGREDVLGDDEIDVGRTLGWFTARYPVWLEANALDADPGCALIAVKEALRAIPNRGVDFGLMRYSSAPEECARARALPEAWVSFNYLGSFDQTLSAAGRFGFAEESAGDDTSPDSELAYALELNGMIALGELSLSFRYSPGVLEESAVSTLVARFDTAVRRLLEHTEHATPRATASDFPLAGLTQTTLDRLELPLTGTLPKVQDIYPATPIQQGLIFQSLMQAERGAYLSQLCLTLRGDLDYDAMRAAWRSALARHAILRTQFEWRHGGEALQIVLREVDPPVTIHDWSNADDYAARLREHRAEDLRQGFDLSRAPLLRVQLIKRPDGAHDLVRTSHHALSDGWSSEQLFAEILEVYAAERQGTTPALEAVAPYRDYISWLAMRPSPRPYWERMLAELDDAATVHLALRVPAADGGGREPLEQQLELALSARLRAFAQAEQITLNTLVQAAWAITLGRLADRTQAIFGATVSGRPPELPDSQRMLGPFINTLPVLVPLPSAQALGAWLAELQRTATERRDYEYTPLRDLQHWARARGALPRTLGGDALFDSLLVFENFPSDDELMSRDVGLVMESSELVDRTHYPLALTIVPLDAGIKLEWEWNEAHVSRTQVARVAELYIAVLQQLSAADASTPLARIGLGATISNTAPATRRFDALPERIAAHAARTPDAPAVECGATRLTYGELDRIARRVAAELERLGVGAEECVGVCVPRDARVPAALLGVWYAGAAWVPLDPSYPEPRLRAIRQDAGIRVIVGVGAGLAGSVTIDLEALSPLMAAPRSLHADQLGYVIYTSGSTGAPKGVAVSQRALALHVDDYLAQHALTPRDVVYQFSTFSFDVAMEQLLPALCAGARVVMRGAEIPATDAFHAELARHAVTHVDLPTAFWQDWTQLLLTSVSAPLTALRTVSVGGELLPVSALAAWLDPHNPLASVRLDNCYGPTEATITACARTTSCADAAGGGVPIGAPYASRSAYVLDVAGEPVGEAAAGELYLGGESLARGYVGRPSATAERFVPDPWGRAGARMYRTGDRVGFRDDAGLEFLGRRDQQIKLRGYRIELGDVEAALLALPGVRAAVVTSREPTRQLVATVVGEVTSEPLRSALAARLPAYLIPSAFEVASSLPLAANGKVDRRALAQRPVREERARAKTEPRSALEATLRAIWSQVLGDAELDVDDDLFHAGADSLSALRVLSAAKRAGLSLALETLFAAHSVAELARELERPAAIGGASSVVLLNQSRAERSLFCVHPLYGTVGAYAPLAAAVSDVARVYGLRAPGFSESDFGADSLDALAREYVRRVREVQPHGPYHLLGWSLGGWIAAAMARELEVAGERVALLAIVDTRASTPGERVSRAELEHDLEAAARGAQLPLDDARLRDRVLDILVLHEELLSRHRIQRVSCDIHSWTAARNHPASDAWSDFTLAEANEVSLDTTHEDIIEHVALFAELRRLLAEGST